MLETIQLYIKATVASIIIVTSLLVIFSIAVVVTMMPFLYMAQIWWK